MVRSLRIEMPLSSARLIVLDLFVDPDRRLLSLLESTLRARR
jgi:hypothetical protein